MAAVLEDRSAQFGKWVWDLRFSHTALLRIQMTRGSLSVLAKDLLTMKAGCPVPEDTAAYLIWAGESWRAPKLTIEKVKRRLATMTELERQQLTTWAVADLLTAILKMVGAQVTKLTPAEADDDD